MSRKNTISKKKQSNSDTFFQDLEALEELENLEKELEEQLEKVSSDSLLDNMISSHKAKPYQKEKRNRHRKKKETEKEKPPSDKPYHHGSLPQTLIEVASELIGTEGIKNLSLRKIAKKAGVSQAAPYRHFEDKEHLLAAVAKEGFYKLTKEMNSRPSLDTTPLETIESLAIGYIKFALENPSYFRMMFSSELSVTMQKHSIQEEAATPIKLFIDAIIEAQDIRLINPHLLTETLAMNLWSMIHGMSFLVLEKQITIGDESIENLTVTVKKMLALFLKGVTL